MMTMKFLLIFNAPGLHNLLQLLMLSFVSLFRWFLLNLMFLLLNLRASNLVTPNSLENVLNLSGIWRPRKKEELHAATFLNVKDVISKVVHEDLKVE